jgi:hypothetical protein
MLGLRQIPIQRTHEIIPDHAASANKAARRQAYRYGTQLRQAAVGSPEHLAVGISWSIFLGQFEDRVIIEYLKSEFMRGVEEAPTAHQDQEMVLV